MSAEGGTLTRQNTSMMQKEATMRSTEATLSGGGNTTTSFGDSYNKTLLQSPSAKTYLRDTTGAESILVSGGAPRYQPWVGDYTLDRFRHLLENGNRFALSGPQLEYEDTFDWDRGGKKSVPYHCKTSYIPGTKTSMAGYPTLLTENAHVGTPPYKAALRLPAISSPVKTITKSVSCVDLSGTFYGKFTTRPTLVATSGGDYGSASGSGSPSARNMRKVMSARSVVPGGEAAIQKISGLTVREVDATQRLWRESMTGDMYFAPPGKKDKDKKRFDPSVDEIPGMGSAFRDGGSINWCNPEADGMSLFALKCAMNEKKMLDYLWLQHGPDIFTHDYKNRNLFHQCARQAACESLTFLMVLA
ncbi:unnamed protein product [Amoebophrya sp. A25]|nr:unnamed protein product [Amoebophrya sp. A25]|eukprot:GSA25T00018240001.1